MPRELSNLECVALAHLWRIGGSTPHELRQAFASSTAGRYSGSAGAIYPLVKRLEEAGYIGSKPAMNGAQKKRVYSIRQKGRHAVQRWMSAMKPQDIFADDPVKTRFQYIRLLNREDQRQWLDQADAALLQQNEEVRAEYAAAQYQNPIDQHVFHGVLEMNKLRRHWINRARIMMDGEN